MLSVADALTGVGLPALVAAVLLLLARVAGGRAWIAALALGGGYLAGHLGLRGWRGWMPRESTDWIAVSAAAGLAVGALGLTQRGPGPLRLVLRFALALAAAWFVVGRSLARRGELGVVLGELAAVAAGATLVWSLLESRRYAAGERPSALSPLPLLLASTSAALAIGLSGSQLLAQLTGVLAATLGAALVMTRLRLAPALLPGAAGVVTLTLLSLLLAAAVHARLPASSALLVALAAICPPPATAAASQPRSGLISLLVGAVLGGAAVGVAYQASPPLDF